MTRVLLDSNILISAIIFKGKPREILDLVKNHKLKIVVSNQLLAEIEEVLGKKFLLTANELVFVTKMLRKNSAIVYPKIELTVCRDRLDNKVIEAAIEGNCEYIVTGDKDLLSLGEYKWVKIIAPSEFLDIIGQENQETVYGEN